MLGRLTFPFAALIFIFASVAFGQGAPKFSPKGVNGHVGAGFSYFQVQTPSSNFRLDQGIAVNLGGEKGFGVLNSYLTFALGYLSSEGQALYHYRTLAGVDYQMADAAFKHDMFNIGIGFRIKLIDGYWFRPYIEGGGTFGYSQLKFNFTSTQRTSLGTGFKDADALFAFGKYTEGGAEIAFSDSFGFFLAARQEWVETKEFEVLYDANNEKQKLTFVNTSYFVGLLKAF